jgi:hypothetical protein
MGVVMIDRISLFLLFAIADIVTNVSLDTKNRVNNDNVAAWTSIDHVSQRAM